MDGFEGVWDEHLSGEDPRLSLGDSGQRDEIVRAMYDIANVLRYPTDHHGNHIDLTFVAPALAYHFALAGLRLHPDAAVIKARPLVTTEGVYEGAIEWVSVDAPDEIVEQVTATTTLEDLAAMSPAARAQAIRNLGGQPPEAAETGWHMKPKITIDGKEHTR